MPSVFRVARHRHPQQQAVGPVLDEAVADKAVLRLEVFLPRLQAAC